MCMESLRDSVQYAQNLHTIYVDSLWNSYGTSSNLDRSSIETLVEARVNFYGTPAESLYNPNAFNTLHMQLQ